MMVRKHRVHLTGEEQEELKGLVSKGRAAAYRQTPARILLLSGENQDGGAMRDADIARALKVGTATYDYEYRRNGVSNLFMLYAPLEDWRRRVEVTDRRTRTGWAEVVRKLVDEDYPDRERIVLVMDNLNTHHPSSLYEAFDPAEARRITERLEIHYTPKHGSWLNMAESELAVLARQCLGRRIPDQEMLQRETRTWQEQRNREEARANWRFTTQDARLKLRPLYPSLQY